MMCPTEDLLLDSLQGRAPAEVAVHAAECAACAAKLREWAPFVRSEPERIEPSEATRAAVFRRKKTTRRIRILRRPASSGAWGYGVAAAAAALFAILLGTALQRPAPPREAPTVRRPEPAPEPEPVPLPPIERPKDLVPPEPDKTERSIRPAPAPAPEPAPVPPAPPPPKPPPSTTVVEAPPPPAPAKEFARVARVTASADVKKGDTVFSGQTVSCKLGTVHLEMADDTQIVLRAGTSITAGEPAIRLHEGEVACSVRKGRPFTVEIAHGVATVRGTMFSVKTQASGASVVVGRGRVEVSNAHGAQDVLGGQRSRLSKGAGPSKPESGAVSLEWAGLRVAGPLWIPAALAETRAPMTRGRLEGSLAPETLHGAVDARTLPGWSGRFLRADGDEGGTATLTIDVPADGVWHLWGRMFHPASGSQVFGPDNDPNSFYLSVNGGPEKVFGNHKDFYRRWHWAGDGAIERGDAAGLKLALTKGRHTLRIRPRDAVESGALRLATRLDVLCLSPDADYRPSDDDYRKK